jgi:hypothetical protein
MADKDRRSESEEPEEQEGGSAPMSRETAETLAKGAAAGAAAGAAVGAAAAAVRKRKSEGHDEPQEDEADEAEE